MMMMIKLQFLMKIFVQFINLKKHQLVISFYVIRIYNDFLGKGGFGTVRKLVTINFILLFIPKELF